MLQLVNPLMLWGLAAASVPVVIHLLNRRRYRRQPWAAMVWLLAASKRNQRRLRIENILLLALRTLAVLLLALALTRPVLSATPLGIGASRRTHLFLVVDNSGSSAARAGLRTTLEEAVGTATTLISELGDDDPVTLLVTNDNISADRATGRPRVVIRESRDHGKVGRLLSELRPAPARADLADALEALDELVPDVDGRDKKVAVVSDLQRTSLVRPEASAAAAAAGAAGATEDGGAPAEADALRTVLQRLRDKGAEVVLSPVGREVDNVAIVSLRPEEERDIVQGSAVAFLAEVVNYSERPQRVEVRFLVDDAEQGDAAAWVDLPPRPAGGGAPPSRTQRFTARFDDGDLGRHVVEARIPGDAVPLDDARSFAFQVRPRLRVLAVDGDPAPDSDSAVRETYWLEPALALREGGPIDVRRVDTSTYLGLAALDDWDLVILANVDRPAPDDDARERLERYVRRGGAVLLTVGDRTLPDVWNDELWRDGEGPLPAALDRADVRPEKWLQMDLGENDHPILRDITDPANAVLFQSPFLRGFMRLGDVDDERGARTVMTYTDLRRSPALVERRFGRGRVLLLTTTVDDAWGDLPGSYVFPALLHETVYVLTSRGNAESNLLAFQPYTKTFGSGFADFEIRYPDGSPARANVENPPDAPSFVSFAGTDRLGTYRTTTTFKAADILAPAPTPEEGLFTVSMNALESDTQRVRTEEISARYADLVNVADDLGGAAEAVRAGESELHGKLLAAALLCLLAEMAVARRIGRRRSTAS